MSKVGYFTPVDFGDRPKNYVETFSEKIDWYFFFGGKTACVLPAENKEGSYGVAFKTSFIPWYHTALKIASYCTLVIPLLALIAKAVLRGRLSFHIVDFSKMVEAGVAVPALALHQLERLKEEILNREEHGDIEWISTANTAVFALREAPGLVFKHDTIGSLNNRVQKNIRGKEVCAVHNLDRLFVPNAKKIYAGDTAYLAERRVDLNHIQSGVEEQWRERKDRMDETVRQLAILIAETEWSDVAWRNLPLDAESTSVALVDIEEANGASRGFYGYHGNRRGLVHCVFTAAQIDTAIQIAKQYGVPSGNAEEHKQRRIEELARDEELFACYEEKGIDREPRQPIPLEVIEELGLQLNQSAQFVRDNQMQQAVGDDAPFSATYETVTMRQVAEFVIDKVNRLIDGDHEKASTKGARRVTIPDAGRYQQFLRFGTPVQGLKALPTEEEMADSWVRQILVALKEKGHIFEIFPITKYGQKIQA